MMKGSIARWLPLLATALPHHVLAQATAIHREPLQTAEFPGHGLHTVVVRTTLDAGGTIAPHHHPGIEIAYLEAGEVRVAIAGAPPLRVVAHGSWQVAPGIAHGVTNAGPGPAVIVSTYIVDSAAPLATSAP